MQVPYKKSDDGLIIEVKVDPRSSRKEVVGVIDNALKIKVTAAPVEGAANEQVIELLSEYFGVRKRDVVILKGETARRKVVKLRGVKE